MFFKCLLSAEVNNIVFPFKLGSLNEMVCNLFELSNSRFYSTVPL